MSLTQHTFDLFMRAFPIIEKAPLVVAVSGGGDSMALTFLLADWARRHHHKLYAATVNHGLRPDAAAEARFVHRTLKSRGISHTVLTWTGEKPTTRIEEIARAKRYELLIDFCRKKNSPYLFLAHHQQDNTETVLARLSKGSGLTGLCGILPISRRQNITLLRPLLPVPKSDILSFLKQQNIPWVEDVMNQDTAFERVCWRQKKGALAQLGLSDAVLEKSINRLRLANETIQFCVNAFMQQHVQFYEQGYARIAMDLLTLPIDLRRRILTNVLTVIGNHDKILSFDSLQQAACFNKKQQTLGGCHIICHKTGIFVGREMARMAPAQRIPVRKWTKWDRFMIYTDTPATVQPLGKKVNGIDLPYLIQRSFPALSDKKGVEIYPAFDYKEKIHKTILIRFNNSKDTK